MDKVDVTQIVIGDALVLRVTGEIDMGTATWFERQLRSADTESTPSRLVVFDLTDVPFLSAAGLRPLLGFANDCTGRGIRTHVVADPSSVVHRVLHLALVGTLLPTFGTVAEAVSGGD